MELLTDVEARVIGCLVEKQRTVPDTYPLTLNALVSACNQSSNRDPVVAYDESMVLGAIDLLKGKGYARIVHPPGGQRATKYRHVLDEALGLDVGEVSLVAVLLLRGDQTEAELRTRTERYHPFGGAGELEAALGNLASRGLTVRLERRPGEREPRWRELLTEGPERDERPTGTQIARRTDMGPTLEERVAKLEEEVALLRQALLE